jgi:putative heme-binding domain-containing protein
LSDRELIEAPRGEFVYVALLERKGIARKYRLEALDGLVATRHTDRLTELLRGMVELDKKGDDFTEPLRDLGSILLHTSPAEITGKREQLTDLSTQAQLALTRQIAFAGVITADGAVQPSWTNAQSTPARLIDLVLGIPLITDTSLRSQFYPKLKPLLLIEDPAELRRAAIIAIVALPNHDAESFASLASLVQAGVQTPAAIESLAKIPQSAWATEAVPPLTQSILDYLQKTPAGERTQPPFANALQFANELALRLPHDEQQIITRTLRKLGPTVITLHAVFEQMRFDQERIVAEAGKPTIIILQNDDSMPHNLAILAPGALKEIGLAAEKMTPEPDAEGRSYVPASPKVLQATRLVNPGEKGQLVFNAPDDADEYPFVCTFPGHWLRMSGTMAAVKDLDQYLASHPATEQPKLTEWKIADFSTDLPLAEADRNPAAGKELFTKLACVQCHKLGSEGYAYGPDLTDVFKRYKYDRASVLDQVLEPSKVIDQRYRNFTIDLKNGDSLVGMILKEDDQYVTIQSGPSDSLIQRLNKSEVQQRRLQTSSPMPVGLLNALSKRQILDLLSYLESGGEPPPHEHLH